MNSEGDLCLSAINELLQQGENQLSVMDTRIK